jgi:hypothetical protein
MAKQKPASKSKQKPGPKSKQGPATAAKASGSRNTPILAISFGAIAAVLVGAIIFGGGGGDSDFEFGSPTVSGDALPPVGGAVDAAVGLPAPTVSGAGFDDVPATIDFDGTAKGILFLAHWCSFCQQEVPKVQAWLDGGGSVPGAELVSVSTATNATAPNFPPDDWLERENWRVPLIVDDTGNSVYRAYGQGNFPFWVFVSGDGTVTRRAEGALPLEAVVAFLEEAASA